MKRAEVFRQRKYLPCIGVDVVIDEHYQDLDKAVSDEKETE